MEQNVRPFGLRDKAGYMFGDLAMILTLFCQTCFY